jgi:hypothetical protein
LLANWLSQIIFIYIGNFIFLIIIYLIICRLNCTGGTLDPRKAKGKILFCLHSQDDCYFSCRIHKGVEAARVGAVGMILANDENSGSGIQADPHVLPSSYVNFIDGSYIFNYINHTK